MPSVSRRYAASGGRFERPSGRPDAELGAPVILMVSGGADSTALLVLAATSALDIDDGRGPARVARERLHVLHVNHGLRGLDAEEDEEFVRDLAARFGVPCTIRRADVAAIAADAGDNVENAGRELRYAEAARPGERALGAPWHAALRRAHPHTRYLRVPRRDLLHERDSRHRRRGPLLDPAPPQPNRAAAAGPHPRGALRPAAHARHRLARGRHQRRHALPARLRAPRGHGPWRGRETHAWSRVSASTCDILSDEDAYLTSVAARALRDLTRREGEGLLVLDAARLAATEVAIARRVVRAALLAVCPAAAPGGPPRRRRPARRGGGGGLAHRPDGRDRARRARAARPALPPGPSRLPWPPGSRFRAASPLRTGGRSRRASSRRPPARIPRPVPALMRSNGRASPSCWTPSRPASILRAAGGSG